MAVSYKKLWKLLIDKDMKKEELRIAANLSTNTMAKLGKNENVSMDVMLRISKVLDCNISYVVDIKDNQ